ncbi:MAG: hypothetical protein IID36_11695 [Planctomycetes bacterium]|nr:hypothetical protein [Planctomycetota bacterium]
MRSYLNVWICLALTAAFIPAVSPGSAETGMAVSDRNNGGPSDGLDGVLEDDGSVATPVMPLADVDHNGAANGSGIAIIFSFPPNGAIDAGVPFDSAGVPVGAWDSIAITFDGDASALTADDFAISVTLGTPPSIVEVQHSGATVTLVLDSAIPAAAWTIFTHIESDTFTALGFLPGDVNADCISTSNDILTLIDNFNGVIDPLPIWSADVDRSGGVSASDVLRVIDLFNGAGEYDVWLGVVLCPEGCPEFGCP